MGNDWRIALSKLAKSAVMGVVAIGIGFFSQIDAQCPGASLAIGGTTVGIKVVLDFLGNIYKHKD